MPEEEKEPKIEQELEHEHPKKFKAVTEEVLPEVKEEKKEPESKKNFFVKETNNIIHDPKTKHDTGLFIKFFLVTFLATLLAVLLAGGIYVYFTGTSPLPKSVENIPAPTVIPTPEVSPTASPSANVDLTTFKVSVLNGNGGIGVATAGKQVLEKAGFKVSYIGNADNFNFATTLVQIKASVPSNVSDKVKTALSANYAVTVGDPLDSASTYDIVVTVGLK